MAKTIVKGKAAALTKKSIKRNKPFHMTEDEKALARRMHFDQKMPPSKVASTLGRDLSAVCKMLAQKRAPAPSGRPRILDKEKIDKLVALLEKMVDDAEACHEVTLAMLMKRSRTKACDRVVANALHERGYWFRDLRHKPILTPDDVRERKAFADKYKSKSASWWRSAVHIHCDNHMFKAAGTLQGRKLLARRRVRGVYRKRGKSLRAGHVKPNPKMRLATGMKGILKTGGVGDGKALVWHTIDCVWGGDEAARVYSDVISPALKDHYPTKRAFTMLEDNDPSGNNSKKGVAAKAASKIHVFNIPKRSPDLNVMDYSIWAEVERKLREQERKMPPSKRETRQEFERRLDRTAANLPKEFIDKAIGDMRRRCELLSKAKGGLFEEGGRARRPL